MKVKQLNALLQKLAKDNPDAEVSLGFSTLIGPQFEDPAVVMAQDGLYIVPKSIEDGIAADMGRDKVGEQVQKIHAEWQADQDAPQGDAA